MRNSTEIRDVDATQCAMLSECDGHSTFFTLRREISEQHRLLTDGSAQAIWQNVDREGLVRLRPEHYFSLIIRPAADLARSWLRGRVPFELVSTTDDLAEGGCNSLRAGSHFRRWNPLVPRLGA